MESNFDVQEKESRRRSLLRSLSYQKTTSKATRRNSSVGPSAKPPPAETLDRANSMTADITYTGVTHIAYYAGPTEK